EESIQRTVDVLEIFTARYASNPSLYAIELLNEPHAPEVLPEKLIEYYEAGYEAVRRRAPDKFVILSSRIGGQPQELFEVAKGKSNVVIDVHYYNLYTDKFAHMTIEEHIKYIQNDRAAELKSITNPNGPLIFVGEWAAIWQVTYPKPEDFQNFAEAQLNVYGEATFGWAFWSQQMEKNSSWSMEWMINNGLITL
ncbi:probable glucan 1,3-beta-glucosidase A, partial [Tanacetum coccineum]